MKTPRYTDNRYPHGYRKAVNTSVAATFKRIRNERKEKDRIEKEAQEARSTVTPMKRAQGK